MNDNELLNKIYKLGILVLITLVCILIVLTIGVSKSYSVNSNSNNTNTSNEYNTDYDVSMFEEIKASDINKKTKKDKQIIYIGRETCGWCAAFLPNLWNAQEEYNFTTLYIDLAKIIDFTTNTISDENSFNILSSLTGEGFDGYMDENLGATPMILIVEKGKIINAQTGYSEYDTFKSLLENSGYKK